jgi:hypothetical protein
MTIGELRDKVAEAGGVIEFGPLKISYKDKDSDVDIHANKNILLAWVGIFPRDKDVLDYISMSASSALENAGAVVALAQFLGIETEGYKPITLEKTVEVIREVESKDAHELRGMVRAYESILIGRQLSVGPQEPKKAVITGIEK